MTQPKFDYLDRPPSTGYSLDTSPITDRLDKQLGILLDIRKELMKMNPSVLATTVVTDSMRSGQGDTLINDTNTHRIVFTVGGKPVQVYKCMIWGVITNSGIVRFSFVPMSGSGLGLQQGFTVQGNTTPPIFLDDITISELYFQGDSASNSFVVNGNTSVAASGATARGGIFVYGFTIPDFEMPTYSDYLQARER